MNQKITDIRDRLRSGTLAYAVKRCATSLFISNDTAFEALGVTIDQFRAYANEAFPMLGFNLLGRLAGLKPKRREDGSPVEDAQLKALAFAEEQKNLFEHGNNPALVIVARALIHFSRAEEEVKPWVAFSHWALEADFATYDQLVAHEGPALVLCGTFWPRSDGADRLQASLSLRSAFDEFTLTSNIRP